MNRIEGCHKDKYFEVKPDEVCAFASGAILENCKVEFRGKNENLIINNIIMINCAFFARNTLEDFQFCKANLKGITFSGRFSGCDFGKWEKKHGTEGALCDYDFSDVELLHNCRFFNCDVNLERLPSWPHVVMVNKDTLKEDLSTITWPGNIGLMMKVLANIPKDCSFVTVNIQELSKRLGGDINELYECLKDDLFLYRN